MHEMEEGKRKREELEKIMQRKKEEQEKHMGNLNKAAEWIQAHWRGLLDRRDAEFVKSTFSQIIKAADLASLLGTVALL